MADFFIKRPILSICLSVIIVLLGAFSILRLPISEYPDIIPPSIQVTATYPGADCETVVKSIASPIEQQMSGVDGMSYMTSVNTNNGQMSMMILFEIGTEANMDQVLSYLRYGQATSQLPSEVSALGVSLRKTSGLPALVVSLYSPQGTYDGLWLANYAYINMVDAIKRVPGVGDVQVFGAGRYAMRIWLNPEKMAALNITARDVMLAVQAQNAVNPAGKIGAQPAPPDQQLSFTVKAPGRLTSVKEFENIVVRGQDSSIVRVGDIARVELGSETYSLSSSVNGMPAASIGIYEAPGGNAIQLVDNIKDLLKDTDMPPGMDYLVSLDSTLAVRAGIEDIVSTLVIALGLVVLVVFIFLQGWRGTLIPAFAVPVSIVGAFIAFPLFGFSINTICLMGLVLAIGLVVDDAIVVVEAVKNHISNGEKPLQATIAAMKEVSGALVAIVLVLSAVFIPVAFLGGIAGELYRQFSVTVAIAVVISGFVALTLTPALCAILLKPTGDKPVSKPFRLFNQGLAAFTMAFLQVVRAALKHRIASALILIAVCIGGWQLLQITPTSFIPKEDQGVVRMAVQLPEGSAFPRTEEVAEGFLKKIQSLDGVQNVVTMMGFDTLGSDIKANAATFILQLKHWNERQQTADDYQQQLTKWLRESPDARGIAVLPAPIPGLGSSNGFSGYLTSHGSDNPLVLQGIAEGFIAELSKRPELTGLRTSLTADSPQLLLTVDRDRAYALGVDVDDVYETISAMMGSSYINDFTRNGKTYRVVMQAEAKYRSLPSDIGRASVRASSGEMVPISTLVTWERVSGPDSLTRMNGYLGSQIMGAAIQGVSSGEAIRIVEETARDYLPPGYQVEWIGQAYHEKRIGASSATAFGFGLLVMFLILAALYERWSLPIAVVLAVPYAFLGAMTAVWLRGTANDIYFQIGLLVLIGLTAKNAILIVEYAEQKMEEDGKGPFDAAIEAAGLRLRPILMTSLAFILGVTPMLLATGAGSAARHSMGTGVFGGMLAATFISTIFVPVFFTWFAKKRKAKR